MTHSFNAMNMAKKQIADLDAQLLRRQLRVTDSACDIKIMVKGRQLTAFCSNDYLGFANHSALISALAQGAQLYGAGSGASHLISGHSIAHELLETKLASFQSSHIPKARALFLVQATLPTSLQLLALSD